MTVFIKQAISLFHAWICQCNPEIEYEEFSRRANQFYPNLLELSDLHGISILHLLSSYGPEWAVGLLVENKKVNLAPDFENGWNTAHRAAYFGNLYVLKTLFIAYPELFDLTDRSGYTPVDILVAQSKHKSRINYYQKNQGEIMKTGGVLQTWGQNQNYTCGAESEAARRYPDKINLPLDDPVIHASFSKYHGLCLAKSGTVYSWGLNQKGRLGFDGPTVELQPKKINFGTENLCQRMLEVSCVASAINHSIYIGKCGRAFVSGQNDQFQLGLGSDTPFTTTPRMIAPGGDKKARKSLHFKLCAAGSVHSVISTENSIYIAGRNIGQFGNEIQNKFEFFTKLSSIDNVGYIRKLVSSDASIALFVSNSDSQSPTFDFNSTPLGDIFLLENGQTKKILSKVKGLLEISLCGGRLRNSSDVDWRASEPKLAILTKTRVLIWSPSERLGRQINFLDSPPNFYPLGSVSLFEQGQKLLIAGNDGQCYFAVASRRRSRKWSNRDIDYISKRAAEDPFSICGYIKNEFEGEDAIAYQLERIPGANRCNKVFTESNGRTFGILTTTHKEEDVKFSLLQAENETKPSSLNEDLYDLYKYSIGTDLELNYYHVHSELFDSEKDKNLDEEKIRKIYARSWDGNQFTKDLTIDCLDGVLECSSLALMARSEYFRMMLGGSWIESNQKNVELDLMVDEVQAMVNFCYSNELPVSVELMSQLSIIADRFLIPSLAALCQQKLGIILAAEECPKTALKAFPFALKYNTMYLARKCTQIISLHLPVLLETGYLDLLENDEIEKMSRFYQEILDEDVIRFKPTIDENIQFDQTLFSELVIASKPRVKEKRKNENLIKSNLGSKISSSKNTTRSRTSSDTKKSLITEVTPNETAPEVTDSTGNNCKKTIKTKTRPKKVDIFDTDINANHNEIKSNKQRNRSWSSCDVQQSSLKDIMCQQDSRRITQDNKNFKPNRRKQARGQDIIRWEQENTIEISKRSPSSPWGQARPVNIPVEPFEASPKPIIQVDAFDLKTPPKTQQIKSMKSPSGVRLGSNWASPTSLNEIMEAEKRKEMFKNQRKSLQMIETEEKAILELTRFYKAQFPTDDCIRVVRVTT